jgi:hypothetical protein
MASPQATVPVSQQRRTIRSANLIFFCRKFETTAPIRGRHGQSGGSDIAAMTPTQLLSASFLLMMSVFSGSSAFAQTEGWLRGPGSTTGKDSKIEADCVTAEDGSVTCDTKVVNPASDTKARPYYNPFND